MKKVALYSRSTRPRPADAGALPDAGQAAASRAATRADASAAGAGKPADAASTGSRPSVLAAFAARHERPLLFAAGGAVVLAVALGQAVLRPQGRALTQADIDAAVLHTLETTRLPSTASKAYEAVRRSVVRVRGRAEEAKPGSPPVEGIGSGVVIVDTGIILTNLHVIAGADRIQVEFDDGTESEASVIGLRPEHDLAVLQAKTLPDDLPAATLRSTADLAPGDEVVAVGFPFGIGPSVSSGVISGLHRDYYSAKGKRVLSNLIQFDAAANPGNSGGPLVTADGEVVGIVTGILNPTEQRVFVGIGFAVPIENAAAAVGISPF